MSNKASEMLVQNQPRINENSPQSTKTTRLRFSLHASYLILMQCLANSNQAERLQQPLELVLM